MTNCRRERIDILLRMMTDNLIIAFAFQTFCSSFYVGSFHCAPHGTGGYFVKIFLSGLIAIFEMAMNL